MNPTREQIEAAREELEGLALDPFGLPASKRKALRLLLTATVPPTDEELAQEADHKFPKRPSETVRESRTLRSAYIAGARREGRK